MVFRTDSGDEVLGRSLTEILKKSERTEVRGLPIVYKGTRVDRRRETVTKSWGYGASPVSGPILNAETVDHDLWFKDLGRKTCEMSGNTSTNPYDPWNSGTGSKSLNWSMFQKVNHNEGG